MAGSESQRRRGREPAAQIDLGQTSGGGCAVLAYFGGPQVPGEFGACAVQFIACIYVPRLKSVFTTVFENITRSAATLIEAVELEDTSCPKARSPKTRLLS